MAQNNWGESAEIAITKVRKLGRQKCEDQQDKSRPTKCVFSSETIQNHSKTPKTCFIFDLECYEPNFESGTKCFFNCKFMGKLDYYKMTESINFGLGQLKLCKCVTT